MSEAHTARNWLRARAAEWQATADRIALLRRRRTLDITEAQHALDEYRVLARDLASARRWLPGSSITQALESLYLSAHALINRPPRNAPAAVRELFQVQIPAVVSSLRTQIFWVVLLFVLSAGAGWWLIATYPELIDLFASPKMINQVQHGHLWTEDILNVTPSSVLSFRILSNNISVSLAAFCFGLLYGLGTFYLIATNGLMLGAAFAFTRRYGLDGQLLNFIVAHGLVELSVICLAGAAGMALGESIMHPTESDRQASFARCAAQMMKLLLLCALLLVGCGLIEGFISPDQRFPFVSRLVIGVGWWFVMFCALTGRLFGEPAATPAGVA